MAPAALCLRSSRGGAMALIMAQRFPFQARFSRPFVLISPPLMKLPHLDGCLKRVPSVSGPAAILSSHPL